MSPVRRGRPGPDAGVGERLEHADADRGRRVDFIGAGVSGETGGDGTLTLDTPEQSVRARPIGSAFPSTEARGNLLVTAADGRVAVVPLSPQRVTVPATPRAPRVADDYWPYLSTDRPLYLPSDTIHFWGIARARENPVRRTVTVQLTSPRTSATTTGRWSSRTWTWRPSPRHVHRRACVHGPLAGGISSR